MERTPVFAGICAVVGVFYSCANNNDIDDRRSVQSRQTSRCCRRWKSRVSSVVVGRRIQVFANYRRRSLVPSVSGTDYRSGDEDLAVD